MPSNEPTQLSKYVDLILRIGLNVRPGQRLFIAGSLTKGLDVRLAPFVRVLAAAAYDRGATYVDVIWGDPQLEVLRLQKASAESLGQSPKWPAAARLEYYEAGDAVLSIHADNPNLLAGLDPSRIAAHLGGIRAHIRPVWEYISRNAVNWCVIAVPLPEWAATVLPDVPASEREERLWQLIYSACRIDQPNPIASWREHISDLSSRAVYLTTKQYACLRYSAPGTDLTIGLPAGHIWNGGEERTTHGIDFTPNLPTEEVFTSPHRMQVDGEVSSTRPFNYGGTTIDGMHLRFKEGKVVEFSAHRGEGMLRELLQNDSGSSRLGEAALVTNSSPIARLGVTFQNVLFDENAACHLALGDAFRSAMKDATNLSDEEFNARGGNASKIHSDFMIGSGAMNIDGITASGEREPILRAGEWAFEV